MKPERDMAIAYTVDGAVISQGETGEEGVSTVFDGCTVHSGRNFKDVHAWHRGSFFGTSL